MSARPQATLPGQTRAGKRAEQARTDDLDVIASSPSLVLALQAIRGYPCVSLLAGTRTAERMDDRDVEVLRALADQALDRLAEAGHGGRESDLGRSLSNLLDAVAKAPTGVAVGVFASRAITRAVRLAVPVTDRAVVDHTFATRDLVRSLHRTPRHLVLVLEATRAQLLDGGSGELRPAGTRAFPLHSRVDLVRRDREDDCSAFLETVDRRLGVFRSLHPCPLVLLGEQRVVEDFLRQSRHAYRLAGVLHTDDVPTSQAGLQARIKPMMESYLASREREALDLLAIRSAADQVASGVPAAWTAARRRRPEMLAVEPGRMFPARLHDAGDTVEPVDRLGDPEVIDDVVDELIELVLARGGWVAFVQDGALAGHDGVALTLQAD